MNRDQVIAALRENEPQLKAAGVLRLSLFGSTARGDRRPDSDIDLLAAFDESKRISLLDVAGIAIQLSELLGQKVDLIEEGTLKPRVQKSVEARSCVPSKDPVQRFEDILQNITLIEEFTEGQSNPNSGVLSEDAHGNRRPERGRESLHEGILAPEERSTVLREQPR